MALDEVMDSAFLVATEEFLLDYEASVGLAPEEGQQHGPLVRLRPKQVTSGACPERSRLKAADRRDRYRKKLQNERETLKRQEQELSIELKALQEAAVKSKEEEKKANTLALSA